MTRYDYTHQYWGHATTLKRVSEGSINSYYKGGDVPEYRGHIFASSIDVDDEITLKMESGKVAIFKIIHVEHLPDPRDMHWINTIPIGYE